MPSNFGPTGGQGDDVAKMITDFLSAGGGGGAPNNTQPQASTASYNPNNQVPGVPIANSPSTSNYTPTGGLYNMPKSGGTSSWLPNIMGRSPTG